MSDFEMATLRQRALEAQRTKAQRGELWMHLPVGLVYGPTGAIDLDPDARVQQAIRLVLQKFDELGSTRQVLLWLRRERISVPVTRGGKTGRYTEWTPPHYTRVHAIVTNPFLAGAYVYGRSESRTTIVDARIGRTSGHDLAVDQWQVVIPDHHPGYLDWASYLRHLSMIESNAYMKPGARKSARGGRSLLAGVLRCRRCGHTLQISYSGRDNASANFRCLRRHHQIGSAACVSCPGKAVEDAVGQQLLQAIAPQAIDAAIAAAQRAGERQREQRQALHLELEQVRYDATFRRLLDCARLSSNTSEHGDDAGLHINVQLRVGCRVLQCYSRSRLSSPFRTPWRSCSPAVLTAQSGQTQYNLYGDLALQI